MNFEVKQQGNKVKLCFQIKVIFKIFNGWQISRQPVIYFLALSPREEKQNRTKGEGEGGSHIEDLACRNRPSREPGRLGHRAPIEPGSFRVLKLIITVNKVQGFELIGRSFAGAEKGGEGMALKISTEAETFSFALT